MGEIPGSEVRGLRKSSARRDPTIPDYQRTLELAAFAVVGEAVLDGTAPVLVGRDVDPTYHEGLEIAIRRLGLGSPQEVPVQPQQRPSTVNPLGNGARASREGVFKDGAGGPTLDLPRAPVPSLRRGRLR